MLKRSMNVPSALVLAVALGTLAVHALYYMPFIADDALISLRYAKRLIDGSGLTWNSGERVEGYSNLLWVLSSSAMGMAGVDLITAVRVLGFLGMAAAISAALYAHPVEGLKRSLPAILVI